MNLLNSSDKEIIEKIENLEKKISQLGPIEVIQLYRQEITVYLIELQRRSSKRSERSSKRFAVFSSIISVASILIALHIGYKQIDLAKIQTIPIQEAIDKDDYRAWIFCKEDYNLQHGGTWPDLYGKEIPCKEVRERLAGKFK